MLKYILRRLIMLIPLLIGISLITFLVMHLAPGKPTDIQTQLNQKVSLQVRERLEKLYGLDQPVKIITSPSNTLKLFKDCFIFKQLLPGIK